MGINTTRYKIVAWAISGIFTAIAGGIYAYWFTFIEPANGIRRDDRRQTLRHLTSGGSGKPSWGPSTEAFLFEGISEIIWSRFLNLHMGILGIIVILIVFFIPNGLIDMVRRGFRPQNDPRYHP